MDQIQISKQPDETECEEQTNKMSELDHFRARMNMPIGTSSWSIPITDDVRKDIERISKEIDQRIKDGLIRDWNKR